MLCLNVMVFLLGNILRNVVAINCPGLPTTSSDIQTALETLLVANSTGVKENVTAIIMSGPFFTCQVQGTADGTYQKVTLIVIYHSNQVLCTVAQFDMECVEISGNKSWNSVAYSLNTPGVDYNNISLWKNCSECFTSSSLNKNHDCQCEFQPFLKHSIKDH